MRHFLLSILIALIISSAFAADTLRVMHYNLLYYDRNTSFCTPNNNNVDRKDENLTRIFSYYQPDILTANEINDSPTSVERILTNTLNTGGINHYKRANFTGQYIVNMLYYNSERLGLKTQSYVNSSPRITDVYTLYVRNEGLERGDTTFIVCIVMHLKAGQSDASARAEAAQQIMDFIAHRNIQGNIMLMGDLNVYSATEEAFQIFTTPGINGVYFMDPVDAIGTWHKNPDFTTHHTQSTRTQGGCFATGGMDDRFDFILATPAILESGGIEYIEGSYWALGQDGNRLMGSLIEPENNSLPPDIIDALYNTSDHLPVVLKLKVNENSDETNSSYNKAHMHEYKYNIRYSNPIDDSITIWLTADKPEWAYIDIYCQMGNRKETHSMLLQPGCPEIIDTGKLTSGLYIIRINGESLQRAGLIVKH